MVWKFCGMAQFPHSFGRVGRNYAEAVPFHTMKLDEITVFYAVIALACLLYKDFLVIVTIVDLFRFIRNI